LQSGKKIIKNIFKNKSEIDVQPIEKRNHFPNLVMVFMVLKMHYYYYYYYYYTGKHQRLQCWRSTVLLRGKYARVSELSSSHRIKNLKEIANF